MMRFLKLLVVGTGMALAVPVAIWVLHPWTLPLRWVAPGTTAYMEHRTRQAAAEGESLELRYRWTPLDEISPSLVRAVLIAEDDTFREHRGVDWVALAQELRYRGSLPPSLRDPGDREQLRAAWEYARTNQDRVRGRSTLTQQLARNLYLSPDRSLVRKGQELLITYKLEAWLPKDRILELYLNVAELGPGIFGVGAAAEHYFGVTPSELTPFQAASLAGTLPHPLTSNPEISPGQMAWRRDLILRRMGFGQEPVQAEVEMADSLEVEVPVAGHDSIPPFDTIPTNDTIPRSDTIPPDTTLTEPAPPPATSSPVE